MRTTLIIMAAGIGSRFGGGIKQLAQMGPGGEIIMDYSIYDAKAAGFDKVVFIIRRDIEQEFRRVIGDRIGQQIEVEYVFQELDDLPAGYEVPKGRTKPWGTGQAILCTKNVVKEPFVIINADDYYGKEAFVRLHDYLVSQPEKKVEFEMGMAGFVLKNTLSENGAVTRGICEADEEGILTKVIETTGICRDEKGRIVCDNPEVQKWITEEDRVSMNMWAGYPEFIEYLETGFCEFLRNSEGDPCKKEYLLPTIVDKLIHDGRARVRVLETPDKWFGVTYKEDKPAVENAFKNLIEQGVYPEKLWG